MSYKDDPLCYPECPLDHRGLGTISNTCFSLLKHNDKILLTVFETPLGIGGTLRTDRQGKDADRMTDRQKMLKYSFIYEFFSFAFLPLKEGPKSVCFYSDIFAKLRS